MLGARIAALRRQAGMSQAELARKLQISASAVGMYEQGRREPSVDTLVALSRLFGVSTDYLLTGRPLPQETEALNRLIRDLTDQAELRLESRKDKPLSRQELAVLMAAMLTEQPGP